MHHSLKGLTGISNQIKSLFICTHICHNVHYILNISKTMRTTVLLKNLVNLFTEVPVYSV